MLQSCWQISSKVILLPIRYVICIFINKQVDIYSLAKLQYITHQKLPDWEVSRYALESVANKKTMLLAYLK